MPIDLEANISRAYPSLWSMLKYDCSSLYGITVHHMVIILAVKQNMFAAGSQIYMTGSKTTEWSIFFGFRIKEGTGKT